MTFLILFSQRSLSSSISCATLHITDETWGKGESQSVKYSFGGVQEGGMQAPPPPPVSTAVAFLPEWKDQQDGSDQISLIRLNLSCKMDDKVEVKGHRAIY